jgi:hypothetical protein
VIVLEGRGSEVFASGSRDLQYRMRVKFAMSEHDNTILSLDQLVNAGDECFPEGIQVGEVGHDVPLMESSKARRSDANVVRSPQQEALIFS